MAWSSGGRALRRSSDAQRGSGDEGLGDRAVQGRCAPGYSGKVNATLSELQVGHQALPLRRAIQTSLTLRSAVPGKPQ